MFSAQCSVFSVQCSVLSVQCSVFSAQCSVFSVQCSVLSVQSSVLSVQILKTDLDSILSVYPLSINSVWVDHMYYFPVFLCNRFYILSFGEHVIFRFSLKGTMSHSQAPKMKRLNPNGI